MQFLEYIFLGFLQGVTEFIPVSSSGHLVVAQNFLSGASDHLFLEFINIGTTLALIVFFRKEIIKILADIKNGNYKLGLNILITSVPAGLVGFILADFISSDGFFVSVFTVIVTMFLVGLVMVILESLPKASAVKGGEGLTKWRAFCIGLAQMTALVPGVSRSGATIIASRLSGLGSSAAAEYSFLASIPIMLGVTFKVMLVDQAYVSANLIYLVVGNLVAFLAGIWAIGFLLRYLKSNSLAVFGWYRIVLAFVLLGVVLLQ